MGTETVTIATYNTCDVYKYPESQGEEARFALVEGAIREVQPDILLAQEVPGRNDTYAAEHLQRLASATGLACQLDTGQVTAMPGNHHDLGLGILWNPDNPHLRPIADSWRTYPMGYWHGLARLCFTVFGRDIFTFTYHAPPSMGRDGRRGEAVKIIETVRNLGHGALAIVGADRNHPGIPGYDPDPYRPPQPGVERREVAYPTDWQQSRLLAAAELHDVAPAIGKPWQPTTGHWPTEQNGQRRIDGFWTTRAVLSMVRDYRVADTPQARRASNHLPAIAVLGPPQE